MSPQIMLQDLDLRSSDVQPFPFLVLRTGNLQAEMGAHRLDLASEPCYLDFVVLKNIPDWLPTFKVSGDCT